MKLITFSVTNFRSITTAHKINVGALTVLVGKNNEGKSNILLALTLAMKSMMLFSENPRMARAPMNGLLLARRFGYAWEKDFPISLQEKYPDKKTILDLNFELDSAELNSIKTSTGIRMSNANIPIRVSFGAAQFSIDIPQRGSPAFKEHKYDIIKFICDKIEFNFIPAVRTERDAMSVINDIMRSELQELNSDVAYAKAVATVKELQQRKLDEIASQILEPLNLFLPSIKRVSIRLKDDDAKRSIMRNDIDIIIDDGNATSITHKGDGIKSLTALAMLNATTSSNMVAVVAIEEPESHLHPEAIHQLVSTVNLLSESRQVIITTHNPLFVCRNKLGSNIIVNSGFAKPARNVKEIRDVLGVIPSDNLINAQYVLVVEGEDDKIALSALLGHYSSKIKRFLNDGRLEIKALSGASNLTYELNCLRGWMCKYFVYLDNDDAGRDAALRAMNKGLLEPSSIKYSICNGQSSSEIEDIYNSQLYIQTILDQFGVSIAQPNFRGNSKWSDRMRSVFLSSGQQWNDAIEKKVKLAVAITVRDNCAEAINPHKRGSFDALVEAIESLIS